MKNALAVVFFLLLMAGIGLPSALPQEEGVVMVSDISGQIASVDKEESSLVIKQLEGKEKGIFGDITIYIDSSTVIEKDDETVSLADLIAGDYVYVEYTASEDGKKIATYIWVETK